MKRASITQNLISLLIILIIPFFYINAQDQKTEKYPNEALGLGVELNDISIGGQVAYALMPDLHIGATFGFYFDSKVTTKESGTYLVFSPYAKYFLAPIKNFRPFVKGTFSVASVPTKGVNERFEEIVVTKTKTSLDVAAGAEWFPYKSVGVYGGINVFSFQLDPTKVIIGIASAFMGIEWFF